MANNSSKRSSEIFVEWEGLTRNNDDAPMVRVYFTAGRWVPFCAATYEEPAEGDYTEDCDFLRAEIDPRDLPCSPLTEGEIAEIAAWFESKEGSKAAQQEAKHFILKRKFD